MRYGFVRAAAVTPAIHVADCAYNAQEIIESIRAAAEQGAQLICLPELCITGYTCGDLFFQETLLNGALTALATIAKATQGMDALISVGVPLRARGKLFNCAAMLQNGSVLGFVPKTHLPNYNEFYEKRHFTSAPLETTALSFGGRDVPFGTNLLFCCEQAPSLKVAVEICEDLWAPLPPSTRHAMAGSNVIFNLSASDETIGKAAYRRDLVKGQSARLLCGYLYADAGKGESTTDMVFAGHNLIAENGTLLSETALFQNGMAITEIDVECLANERAKNTTFTAEDTQGYLEIPFELKATKNDLKRNIAKFPFVPAEGATRSERCEAILSMQVAGLQKRMEHIHGGKMLVGISGGLDSCLALLVMARACKALGQPLTDIIAVTMPCFGTTKRTRGNAEVLCGALGVTLKTVDITATVRSNFADIEQDENKHDVTFENVQARVRTLVLMNMANSAGGIVVGTGDLSELALGWATYNGDHMSMYGVNCSVPKTLIRHLVAHEASRAEAQNVDNNQTLTAVLRDILATPVSPELLPATAGGEISQCTEEIVGPYELHDFFLYYAVRWSFSPTKIYFLANSAFCEEYDNETLLKWLKSFYQRFFSAQFKRSCLPDGPKVGSVTLSPRGDWRMPSDAVSALWLAELNDMQIDSVTYNS